MKVNEVNIIQKRVAIYARYSHTDSSAHSVEDQIAACESYATNHQGWIITGRYQDKSISGSGTKNRPGYVALIRDARAGKFDIILAEHPDRLSRSTSDMTALFDQCRFDQQEIWGVNTGRLDQMSAAMHGLMAQHQREETGRKVHRGMRPKAAAGLFMGGQPYGYRLRIQRTNHVGDKGVLEIADEQAVIIRRIYQLYVDGNNARSIAHALNQDHVPAPKGGLWNASTINGEKARGNGILRNPLYVGKPSWNKVSMKKVPGNATRRLSKPNDASSHVSADRPDLQIVSDALFQRAQARNEERAAKRPSAERTKKRVLSGLLRCASCGGGMSIKDRDKTGKVRIQCSTHVESRSCAAPHTVYLDVIERKVVESVLDLFGSKTNLDFAVSAARAELRQSASDETSDREQLVRRVSELERKSKKLIDRFVDIDGGEEHR